MSIVRRVRDRVFWTPWSPRWAAAVAVLVCGLGVAVLALGSPSPERAAILFLTGAGWVLLGAAHRTGNDGPLGAIAILVGAGWFIGRLDEADDRLLFTVGQVLSMMDVPWALLALVAFPTGRLSRSPAAADPATGRMDSRRVHRMRLFIAAAAVWALPLNAWPLVTPDPAFDTRFAGRNMPIADLPGVAMALQVAQVLAVLVIGVIFVRLFERTFRRRGPLHRLAHVPVRVAVWLMVAAFCAYIVSGAVGWTPLTTWASLVAKVVFMMVPLLYGFGLFRWAELEATAMLSLERSGARDVSEVEGALRTALHEPHLKIDTTGASAPAEDDLTRTAVRAPNGTMLAVAHHDLRQPDSALLDRALAWAGRRLAPADATDHPDEAARWTELAAGLTDAELATAELLSRRLTNRQIAERFHLALGTVHNRATRIYQKLELDQLTRRERAAVIARLGHVIQAEGRRRGTPAGEPQSEDDTP